jgi:site-specific DNA recombinase
MKPFIPYARVSSDEQKDAETIKTQMAQVEAHAGAHGLTLSGWVTDDGVSGMVPFGERPGGARAMEMLRTGSYAGVLCLNHKRLGRDAYVIHLAVRQIEQDLGLDIQAVREPVPSQLAPGARALMRAMYAGVAQYDREELLAAMRAGKVRAAKEGRWSGGKVPYGLRLESVRMAGRAKPVKRLVPDEEASGTILEIFTRYAAGATQARIAEELNARGVPHPTGNLWEQSTLSYILRNPVYKGEGSWRRRYEAKNPKGTKSKYNSPDERVVRYEDYQVPAVVPPELWARCAHLRDENMRLASRNSRRVYLLRGIVRCGLCDRSMTGVSYQRKYTYYRCTSRAERNVPNCALRDVGAERLERKVWEGIERFAASPGRVLSKIREAMAAGSGASRPAPDFEKALTAKRREEERVITWARQGRITEEQLDAQLAQLRAEVVALEVERAGAEWSRAQTEAAREYLRDAEGFLEELARRLHELTREEMAAIVRRAVSRVIVLPRGDGRKVARATYRFAPPVILGTDLLRAVPSRRRGSARRRRRRRCGGRRRARSRPCDGWR